MDTAIARPELLLVADAVAREKNIDREEVLEAMEQAIQKAGRAKYGHEKDIRATIDRKTGDVRLSRWTEAVETVENEETQIPVHIARKFQPDIKLGGHLVDPLPPIDFGRIAAQTAKQVIVHKVREAERHRQYDEFKDVRFTGFGGSRAFQTPAFSPKWTMRFAAQQAWTLADGGTVTVGGAARFRSEMALAVDNTPSNSAVKLPGMFQDDYWLFDARAVWDSPDGRLSFGLYGQNLSDEVYRTDAQEFSSVGGIRTVYYGAPRTYLARFTFRY